uniref:Uncharacterized protein n=1 Tax=Rhizophora mucronata TaxID=61149 RepID=A0A2P2N6E4_RHIMU
MGRLSFLAKFLMNQWCLEATNRFPAITPTTRPLPYPIRTTTQPMPDRSLEWPLSCSEIEVGNGGLGDESWEFSHDILDNGNPQSPGFPIYELFSKVANCLPCGIRPSS